MSGICDYLQDIGAVLVQWLERRRRTLHGLATVLSKGDAHCSANLLRASQARY
jgi:hypothetical protein